MKKILKRILIGFGIFLLLIIAAAIILPMVYKNKIVTYAKEEANKSLNAKLDFDNDISLSLFTHFPDFSLGINHIRIINKAPFEGDTLVDIGSFKATLDLMSVIRGGKIQVKTINLDKPFINLQVMANGQSNWDIAIKSKDTLKKEGKDTSSTFKLGLKKYAITNAKIIYDDKSNGFYMKLDSMNHNGSGDFTSDIYDLNTHTDMKAMTVGYGGINYLYEIKTRIEAILNINMKESKYGFKDNDIQLNGLDMNLDGYVAMPGNDIVTDLTFKSKRTDFKDILSLVPGIYQKNFKDLKSSGKMAFGGDVKGVYNSKAYPGFHFNMAIENGMFQYPGLPGSINNVNINTSIQNPGGSLDNTEVNIEKAHLEMGGETVDARLLVKTPMSDPSLDGSIKAKITLGKIKNFINLGSGTELSGLVDANLQMSGRMSAIEKKAYDKFHASGYINCQDMVYNGPSVGASLKIASLRLDFNPQNVKLSNTSLTYGASDLKAEGSVDNLLGYVLKNETLTGNLSLTSNLLDVNSMMPKSKGKKAESKPNSSSTPMSVVEIPANLNFTLKSTISKLLYDTYDIRDFNGFITIKDKRLAFNNISLKMLNAGFVMSGYYDSKNLKKPVTEVNLDIKNLDIPTAYKQFVTIEKFAPVAKYINGIMSGKISLNSSLGSDMMPDLGTLISNGVLDIPKAQLSGFAPLDQLADQLKMPNLKSLSLSGIHPSYYITNGRFYLKEPIQFMVDKSKFNIIGSSGLDKSLDYTMQVELPATQLQSQANSLLNNALQQKGIKPLPEQNIKANILITGTIDKPVFKISMKDLVAGSSAALKDQAKAELEKQKKDLQNKAQQQIDIQKDKLKQEQQKAQDELTKKVDAEKKKQQDQINKQVDQQKKNLEDQGKNKLKDLFKR